MTCPVCKGERWVCENHEDKAWPTECECGAGAPCPVCNVPSVGKFPDYPPGSVEIWNINKGTVH